MDFLCFYSPLRKLVARLRFHQTDVRGVDRTTHCYVRSEVGPVDYCCTRFRLDEGDVARVHAVIACPGRVPYQHYHRNGYVPTARSIGHVR